MGLMDWFRGWGAKAPPAALATDWPDTDDDDDTPTASVIIEDVSFVVSDIQQDAPNDPSSAPIPSSPLQTTEITDDHDNERHKRVRIDDVPRPAPETAVFDVSADAEEEDGPSNSQNHVSSWRFLDTRALEKLYRFTFIEYWLMVADHRRLISDEQCLPPIVLVVVQSPDSRTKPTQKFTVRLLRHGPVLFPVAFRATAPDSSDDDLMSVKDEKSITILEQSDMLRQVNLSASLGALISRIDDCPIQPTPDFLSDECPTMEDLLRQDVQPTLVRSVDGGKTLELTFAFVRPETNHVVRRVIWARNRERQSKIRVGDDLLGREILPPKREYHHCLGCLRRIHSRCFRYHTCIAPLTQLADTATMIDSEPEFPVTNGRRFSVQPHKSKRPDRQPSNPDI